MSIDFKTLLLAVVDDNWFLTFSVEASILKRVDLLFICLLRVPTPSGLLSFLAFIASLKTSKAPALSIAEIISWLF